MNGAVVFDPEVLNRVLPLIEADKSFVVVNTSKVSDEEVKYTLSSDGFIHLLSKQVVDGLGVAVGINFVSSKDKQGPEQPRPNTHHNNPAQRNGRTTHDIGCPAHHNHTPTPGNINPRRNDCPMLSNRTPWLPAPNPR